jgi:hypothetical protein
VWKKLFIFINLPLNNTLNLINDDYYLIYKQTVKKKEKASFKWYTRDLERSLFLMMVRMGIYKVVWKHMSSVSFRAPHILILNALHFPLLCTHSLQRFFWRLHFLTLTAQILLCTFACCNLFFKCLLYLGLLYDFFILFSFYFLLLYNPAV